MFLSLGPSYHTRILDCCCPYTRSAPSHMVTGRTCLTAFPPLTLSGELTLPHCGYLSYSPGRGPRPFVSSSRSRSFFLALRPALRLSRRARQSYSLSVPARLCMSSRSLLRPLPLVIAFPGVVPAFVLVLL